MPVWSACKEKGCPLVVDVRQDGSDHDDAIPFSIAQASTQVGARQFQGPKTKVHTELPGPRAEYYDSLTTVGNAQP